MTHTITVHNFDATDARLGRHVKHDSRSLNYEFLPRDAKPKKTDANWVSETGPLNQGQVGSCTGNATAQFLNTTFSDATRKAVRRGGGFFTEADALKIYSLATHLDRQRGIYPPTDTGSTGLGVAKAAERLGFVKAYKHIFSFSSAQATAEMTPFIQGTLWTNTMFKPNNGLVKVGPLTESNVAGGHEYQGAGIDWKEEVFIYRNSWGDENEWPGCKPGGYFAIGFKDVQELLANQGDITVLVGAYQK